MLDPLFRAIMAVVIKLEQWIKQQIETDPYFVTTQHNGLMYSE